MTKSEELANPNSCFNRATADEQLFILLGRDPSASLAIRVWANNRIERGLNTSTDEQMISARMIADKIDADRR